MSGINGTNVLLPYAFEQAGVRYSIADIEQNAIDVTFNEVGSKILHSLTEQAAEAGDSARLLIRIGGELQAAVAVMEALEGNPVQIALSSDASVQDIVALIQED